MEVVRPEISIWDFAKCNSLRLKLKFKGPTHNLGISTETTQ